MWGPCLVQGFQNGDGKMESRGLVWWEWLLGAVCMLQQVKDQGCVKWRGTYAQKTQKDANTVPLFVCQHECPDFLYVVLCFLPGKFIDEPVGTLSDGISKRQLVTISSSCHLFQAFHMMQHHVCWWPPDLHVEHQLHWLLHICLDLDRTPHLFPLCRRTFLHNDWSDEAHLIPICRHMILGTLWIKMRGLAVRPNESLCCQIDDMCEAAARPWVPEKRFEQATYLILCWRHLYFFLIDANSRAASSWSMVVLFDALSQVTWPTWARHESTLFQHQSDRLTLCAMPTRDKTQSPFQCVFFPLPWLVMTLLPDI